MTCTAKIRPLPNDTELQCEREHHLDADDKHRAVLRDYAYPGSETAIEWFEYDRRTFHGDWTPCTWPTGCTLPATHIGNHAP